MPDYLSPLEPVAYTGEMTGCPFNSICSQCNRWHTWAEWLWWHHWFGLFMIVEITAHKLMIRPESCGTLLGQNIWTIPEHKGQNKGLNWCNMNPPLWWLCENRTELNSLSTTVENIHFAYKPKQLGKTESPAALVYDHKYEAIPRYFLICKIIFTASFPSVKYISIRGPNRIQINKYQFIFVELQGITAKYIWIFPVVCTNYYIIFYRQTQLDLPIQFFIIKIPNYGNPENKMYVQWPY